MNIQKIKNDLNIIGLETKVNIIERYISEADTAIGWLLNLRYENDTQYRAYKDENSNILYLKDVILKDLRLVYKKEMYIIFSEKDKKTFLSGYTRIDEFINDKLRIVRIDLTYLSTIKEKLKKNENIEELFEEINRIQNQSIVRTNIEKIKETDSQPDLRKPQKFELKEFCAKMATKYGLKKNETVPLHLRKAIFNEAVKLGFNTNEKSVNTVLRNLKYRKSRD